MAEELRSVYTPGYNPSNREFDGAWHRHRVNVKDTVERVRTRPGYYGS